jgi:hypothetical protein
MAAASKLTADVVIPNAARSDSAYLTAMERITPQITAKLQLEDVLATIHLWSSGGVPRGVRPPLAARPRDLCTACD